MEKGKFFKKSPTIFFCTTQKCIPFAIAIYKAESTNADGYAHKMSKLIKIHFCCRTNITCHYNA